jgi:hypothetical protein
MAGSIDYPKNPAIPTIPHMTDISDLFANLSNNMYHLRSVFALLFGCIFAFFLLKKILSLVKGDDDG